MPGRTVTSSQAADGGSADGDSIPAAAFTSRAARTGYAVKPLSKAQRDAALAVARKDPKLKEALGRRSKVLFVEPNLTGRGSEHPGQAVVGVHDYKANRSVVAVVDAEAKKVVGMEEVSGQLQLGEEERKQANALAAKDKRVREFLDGRALDPLTRLYFPPTGDASHRYAIVFARPQTSERRYVVVDLSVGKVIDVLEELATRGAHGA
jgi:hypothetical protein